MTKHDEAVDNRTTGVTDVDWLDQTVIEQGDTITTLKAQVSELKVQAKHWKKCQEMAVGWAKEWRERAEAAEAENVKLREALARSLDWMEALRASGDAGNWDWDSDDVYTEAHAALNTPE